LSILQRLADKTSQLGAAGLLRCAAAKAWLRLVRAAFGFESWHASAPAACRPYKGIVRAAADALGPGTAVEVGCGLGEIVAGVRAGARYGIDIDPAVLRAALFLHGRRVSFTQGSLEAAADLPAASIDVLIMCNWLHSVETDELRGRLRCLLAARRVGHIVIDVIHPGVPGFRCHHDPQALFRGMARVTRTLDDGGEGVRSIVVARVNGE